MGWWVKSELSGIFSFNRNLEISSFWMFLFASSSVEDNRRSSVWRSLRRGSFSMRPKSYLLRLTTRAQYKILTTNSVVHLLILPSYLPDCLTTLGWPVDCKNWYQLPSTLYLWGLRRHNLPCWRSSTKNIIRTLIGYILPCLLLLYLFNGLESKCRPFLISTHPPTMEKYNCKVF